MADPTQARPNIVPGSPGAWLVAIRPKTLLAAVAPVAVGSALAHRASGFCLTPALFALCGALLLQIASNLANDLFDYEQGKDTADRLGPVRAVQSGLLSPKQARTGLAVVLFGCLVVGSYLVGRTGWPLVAVGISSMLAAIAYTAGPFPLGYHGLGDVFAFSFFGPVAVAGTQYAVAEIVTAEAYWASVSVGALVANILVVNNLRDRTEDARTGKHTLAVRFGERFCVLEASVLLGVAFLTPAYFWLRAGTVRPLLLPLLTLPLSLRWLARLRLVRGRPMNALLAEAARILFAFAVLFSIGLWISA
jgi:1,4-dihydroxy-2-naphthoate polyprenyltransferase